MTAPSTLRYRISRSLGRLVTRLAAMLTLYRMPPFVSTSALVREGDNLLVVFDPVRKEPILPGGHLKWREAPQDALVREVREETGIVVRVDGMVGVFSGPEYSGEDGVVRVIYAATMTGGRLASSGEGQAAWLPVERVRQAMDRDREILERWLENQPQWGAASGLLRSGR